MQGPIDEAAYEFINKALIFMREHAREDPDVADHVDIITQCLQSVFHIYPSYQTARGQDALTLALNVKWDQQSDPSMPSTFDSTSTSDLSYIPASSSMSGLPSKRVRFKTEVAIHDVEPSIPSSDGDKNEAEECTKLGNRLCSFNQYAEAIIHYNKAIELKPSNADYYYNRAVAFSFQKNYSQCMEDCIKAISLNSNHRKAYGRLGLAYCHLLDFENAQAALMQTIEFERHNTAYKWLLQLVNQKLHFINSGNLVSSIEDDPDFLDAFEAIEIECHPEFC